MKQYLFLFLKVIFVFFVLYYPPIIRINILHVLAVISIFYIINNKDLKRQLIIVVRSTKIYYVIFLYSLFVLLVNGVLTSLASIFLQCFELIPICVYCHYLLGEYKKVDLCNIIIIAAILQSLLAVVSFVNPQIQSLFIEQYMKSGFNDIFEKMAGWRMYGFSYTLAYSMPIIQSIIASICLYKAIKRNIIFLIPIPFLVFSSIINARTGIVIFLISMTTVFCMSIFSIKLKNVIKIALAMLSLTFVPVFMIDMLGDSDTLYWILDGTEDINNFASGTEYNRTSYFLYATNSENYKLPSNIFSLLIGTGYTTTRGNTIYASDVGFINQIWSIGIIGTMMLLFFYFRNTARIISFYFSGFEKNVLIVGAFIVLFVSNIKGNAFSWNELTQLWFLIYTKYCLDKNPLIKNEYHDN